jgi:histidine triad (HIT) family protein
MFNHAPEGYVCPFCLAVRGVEDERTLTRQADVVLRTDLVAAFVSSHQFENTPGHVLVVPIAHHENLYDLPLPLAAKIHEAARAVALAMKAAYACEGISTRQHNEPAGNQDVWHYHLHVFPRHAGDNLYGSRKAFMPPEERAAYAAKLRAALTDITPTH